MLDIALQSVIDSTPKQQLQEGFPEEVDGRSTADTQGREARDYPDDSIRSSRKLIVKTCLSAGLNAADADDIAQDLWEWLIRAGVPIAVITTPWLRASVRNYILRFRRRSSCHRAREGRSLESTSEPESPSWLPLLESNELLDKVAAALPKTERHMLALIRRGYTIADAARMLDIPTGSRDFHKGRLIAYARRELQRRRQITIAR